MTERTARWAVRGLAALLPVLLVAVIGLSLGDELQVAGDAAFIVIAALGLTSFAAIGLIIAGKAPTNPIGWLYALGGIGLLGGITLNEYATRAGTDLDLPAAGYAQFAANAMSNSAIMALLLGLLLFPTGILPSPRWRIVRWALLAGLAAGIANAFVPAVNEPGTDVFIENPLHIPAIAGWAWLGGMASVAGLVGGIGACASIVVRAVRPRGEERQQIRWLAFAVGVVIALIIVLLVSGDSPLGEVAFVALSVAILVGIPAATAAAVLRYRLYDLDLVIRKTVIFAFTVTFLMVVGVGLLLALSSPLTDIAPDETQAVGITGLVIGVLTFPLWGVARRVGDRLVYGGRTTPYEALTEFSGLSEAYATDDVLPRMAAVLGESTRAAAAHVWVVVGGTFRSAAAWPSDASLPDAVAALGDTLPSFANADQAVEVRHRGELLGALTVTSHPNDPVDTGRLALMRDLAGHAGIVLRNVRLIEELRASRQRLVAAQDGERRKLERNIHDGVQQQLVALTVHLRLAEQLTARDPDRAASLLVELQGRTTDALEDLRDLARGIYPPLLADQGLPVALGAQARKSSTPATVEAEGIGRYAQEVEAAVYFSCLEALNNVAKYADAATVVISLEQRDGVLSFRVRDDGRGFDRARTTHGSGLQGIADRLDAIGGEFVIASEPGRGTTIEGRVPIG